MERDPEPPKPDARFLGFLVAVYVIAFAGYLGLRRGLTWYAVLIHPNGALPAWAFGPLWVALCILLGGVAWRLWSAPASPTRTWALGLFGTQLVLHAGWLWLLFGFQKPVPALYLAVLCGLTAIAAYLVGHRVRGVTAFLLAPYLVWLCYGAFLTYGLWSLNFRAGAGVSPIETVESQS
ncbi:MAG TPA: TspO/MBR family protein [Fimbriimonadaceae bacterium]|nr:TspO/MBR family protein [Fimbriimonadaceae bacterium]